ncbi:MAG: glycoside hydrolase family 78 protein [bacterium]
MKITNLRCEYTVKPIFIENKTPRFSWEMQTDRRGAMQSAYRIIIATTHENLSKGNADIWDSGKISSNYSNAILYAGQELLSNKRYYWMVQVWDETSNLISSESTYFETALLNEDDWTAKWISKPNLPANTDCSYLPAPYLRKSFDLNKTIIQAKLYCSGIGFSEFYINGQLAGDERLNPAFTRYDKSVLYTAYDIKDSLNQGENVIGAILGNGWYNIHSHDAWNFEYSTWRDTPKMIAQLHLTFSDGTEELIISDNSWKASFGPIIFNSLRHGEFYDARKEIINWSSASCDDKEWEYCFICAEPGGKLTAQSIMPIRRTGEYKPVLINEIESGKYICHLAKNIAGWVKLKVSGEAGTEVKIRYSEKKAEDGNLDRSNIDFFVTNGEFQTDKYILKGDGEEIWEPRFTYHGFQYIEITGFPGKLTIDNITAISISTDFNSAGDFSCSNELFNQIQEAARRSYLSNFMGLPTDCPHREKNGWMGDAQLACEMGLLNFDGIRAYEKWLNDMSDEQRRSGQLPGIVPTSNWGYNWGNGPAWDSAYVLIPWYLYLYTGDTLSLSNHYDGMKRYVEYARRSSTNGIAAFGLGDWCPPVEGRMSNRDIATTGYVYIDTIVVAKTAELLNKTEDAAKYYQLAEDIKLAYHREFFDSKNNKYNPADQTALGTAIYQQLADGEKKEIAANQLIEAVHQFNDHLDTGILGTKYLLTSLTAHNQVDLAYKIANQRDFPSWGYWFTQGATTLWECWDTSSSHNHIMFGSIADWFIKDLAGINPDPQYPGFKNIIIRPNPAGDLTWAAASHNSIYGEIKSSWQREGSKFELSINIPANCTANVYLPTNKIDTIRESGRTVMCTPDNNYVKVNVCSGSYKFCCELP